MSSLSLNLAFSSHVIYFYDHMIRYKKLLSLILVLHICPETTCYKERCVTITVAGLCREKAKDERPVHTVMV